MNVNVTPVVLCSVSGVHLNVRSLEYNEVYV